MFQLIILAKSDCATYLKRNLHTKTHTVIKKCPRWHFAIWTFPRSLSGARYSLPRSLWNVMLCTSLLSAFMASLRIRSLGKRWSSHVGGALHFMACTVMCRTEFGFLSFLSTNAIDDAFKLPSPVRRGNLGKFWERTLACGQIEETSKIITHSRPSNMDNLLTGVNISIGQRHGRRRLFPWFAVRFPLQQVFSVASPRRSPGFLPQLSFPKRKNGKTFDPFSPQDGWPSMFSFR